VQIVNFICVQVLIIRFYSMKFARLAIRAVCCYCFLIFKTNFLCNILILDCILSITATDFVGLDSYCGSTAVAF